MVDALQTYLDAAREYVAAVEGLRRRKKGWQVSDLVSQSPEGEIQWVDLVCAGMHCQLH